MHNTMTELFSQPPGNTFSTTSQKTVPASTQRTPGFLATASSSNFFFLSITLVNQTNTLHKTNPAAKIHFYNKSTLPFQKFSQNIPLQPTCYVLAALPVVPSVKLGSSRLSQVLCCSRFVEGKKRLSQCSLAADWLSARLSPVNNFLNTDCKRWGLAGVLYSMSSTHPCLTQLCNEICIFS